MVITVKFLLLLPVLDVKINFKKTHVTLGHLYLFCRFFTFVEQIWSWLTRVIDFQLSSMININLPSKVHAILYLFLSFRITCEKVKYLRSTKATTTQVWYYCKSSSQRHCISLIAICGFVVSSLSIWGCILKVTFSDIIIMMKNFTILSVLCYIENIFCFMHGFTMIFEPIA